MALLLTSRLIFDGLARLYVDVEAVLNDTADSGLVATTAKLVARFVVAAASFSLLLAVGDVEDEDEDDELDERESCGGESDRHRFDLTLIVDRENSIDDGFIVDDDEEEDDDKEDVADVINDEAGSKSTSST